MAHIVNLTMAPTTNEQQEQGVFDLTDERLIALRQCLAIDDLPTIVEILDRCNKIRNLIPVGTTHAMVGGPSVIQIYLVRQLQKIGITPGIAFIKREEIYINTHHGSEKAVFYRHVGFTWIN